MFTGLYRSRHGENDVVYVVPPSQVLEHWVTKDTYEGIGEPTFDDLPFKATPEVNNA